MVISHLVFPFDKVLDLKVRSNFNMDIFSHEAKLETLSDPYQTIQ